MAAQLTMFERVDHDPGGRSVHRNPKGLRVEATFVPHDGRTHRVRLVHVWDEALWRTGGRVLWVMMNPSVADERSGDPTVAKCRRIAVRLGFGGQYIGNVCAYRATDKRKLLEVRDPGGPGNVEEILAMAAESAMTIIAHGQLPKGLQDHADRVVASLVDAGIRLHVVGLSLEGIPMHPLARGRNHIPEDVVPKPWVPRNLP